MKSACKILGGGKGKVTVASRMAKRRKKSANPDQKLTTQR
jgi:hypothetical protein